MGLYRPERFEEVRGQGSLVSHITDKINQGTLPNFIILSGEEGLGKTTLAKLIALALNCKDHFKPCYKCSNCLEITQKVIRENKDTQSVKSFRMSVNREEGVVSEIIASFNSIIRPDQKRVLILDEGHGMKNEAQDALLTDTEYIPKDTYVILITSEILNLKSQLVSRAVEFHLKRLPPRDLIDLLRKEASRRNLDIQAQETAFELIASYSDNKARKALKVLEGLGENSKVPLDLIKEFIDFLDVSTVIPIISSLANNGSIIVGMNTIMEMSVDQTTHRSMVEILQEALKFSMKQKSFKLTMEDNKLLREAVEDVEPKRLATFLYEVAAMRNSFTKQGLLAAYLKCHPMLSAITTPNKEVLSQELQTKYLTKPEESIPKDHRQTAPTLDELLKRSIVLEE